MSQSKTYYTKRFQKNKDSQTSQKTQPVRAVKPQINCDSETMGSCVSAKAGSSLFRLGRTSERNPPTKQSNSVFSRASPGSPDVAPIHNAETTSFRRSDANGRSNGRESRARGTTDGSRLRSASQQPKLGQHNPTNHPEISLGCSTTTPDYSNHERNPYITASDSTATHYPYIYYGAGVGTDSIPSRGDTSYKGWTKQPEHQLPYDIALIHTPSSVSFDANGRSTGRQSRSTDKMGTPRLRSASQGLRNLGNTCYMNSILQCLAKVPWFTDKPSLKFGDDLLNEFFSLMKKMQENESESSLDPYQFRKQIGALGIRFSSSEQNDAHEFLLCLLSRLSKALKREGKSDVVADFLLGQQQNVIRFKKCNHTLINDQPFFSLLLPLTQESGQSVSRHTTVYLEQCLKNYTKKEDVDGDALCMDCQLMQLCSIEASFKRLPKFLVIYLKRYDFMKAEKLENEVRFREALRMTQKPTGEVSGSEDYVDYDLIAVCNHYGSLRFGHYTADIKSPSNNWYNYSDSRVTKTEISLSSRDAYILFYLQRPN